MHKLKSILLPILLFFGVLTIYTTTTSGTTPFDYFSRLADSFLIGKYWLTEQPPWLTELIPITNNKYYVVYPPMPAILLTLPRLLFKNLFEQQYLAQVLGAGISVIVYFTALSITKNKLKSVWVSILISLGSIVWFLSSVGSSWYLGQISAAFFMFLAVYESVSKKRAIILGILLGASYLSRINTAVCVIYILYILADKNWLKNFFYLGIGCLPFILFNFTYNYLRFGTIFDQAYFLLPAVLNETNAPWFSKGVVNLAYIPNNLRVMFWSFPKHINEFPYIIPSWEGLSIWITTPAFIYTLFANTKENLIKFAWLTIFLVFVIVASHGGTGWSQFGYRFAVDFYPFLVLILIKYLESKNLRWHHWFILFASIIINSWGVIFINKFGWVGF